jgi:hypothetical protein
MKTKIAPLFMIGLVACSAQDEASDGPAAEPKGAAVTKAEEPGGKAEAWGVNDRPDIFASGLEKHISRLPTSGEAAMIPWASSYWPMWQDNLNFRWEGAGTQSPAAKYGAAFGVAGVEDGVSANHGIDQFVGNTSCTSDSQCNDKLGEKCSIRNGQTSGRCIPTWYGICPGWTAAAILHPEPKYPVEHNGVTFKINDIKALISLVHENTSTRFVSLRCNKNLAESEIHFDHYGRPNSHSPECGDSNAGTFYVLLANYLGIQRKSFAYDRTMDYEVWNQPLRGYRVTKINAVTAAVANSRVGVQPTGGTTTNRSGSVGASAWNHLGSFTVAGGQGARVVMTGSGDADLYVNFDAAPTTETFACRPYASNSAEECNLTVPAGATRMFVSINGYTASSYNVAVTTGATLAQAYQFNPNAVYFYDVTMQVDYITESASELDGNLAADINRYTKTDTYEMILEVNRDGFVIGGEWVGDSKRNHPDFLWLPLAAQQSVPVAGGKITYANVKWLLDKSQTPGSGGGTTGQDREVNEAATLAQGAWRHYGPFNVAAGKNLTATMTGTGDADLYVRKVATPTSEAFDCRPYLDGSAESCSVVGPAAVFVSVHGYTASSVQLKIKYTEGTGGGGGGTPPPSFTHLNQTGSVALNEMKMFQLPIPAGKRVVVRTTSSVDVDLYIMMDGAPTTSTYAARGYTDSGNETLTFTAPSNGTLFVGVHGYAAGSFTLRTSDN